MHPRRRSDNNPAEQNARTHTGPHPSWKPGGRPQFLPRRLQHPQHPQQTGQLPRRTRPRPWERHRPSNVEHGQDSASHGTNDNSHAHVDTTPDNNRDNNAPPGDTERGLERETLAWEHQQPPPQSHTTGTPAGLDNEVDAQELNLLRVALAISRKRQLQLEETQKDDLLLHRIYKKVRLTTLTDMLKGGIQLPLLTTTTTQVLPAPATTEPFNTAASYQSPNL